MNCTVSKMQNQVVLSLMPVVYYHHALHNMDVCMVHDTNKSTGKQFDGSQQTTCRQYFALCMYAV